MKKILYLLPLLLIILACGALPAPTRDVSNLVNATLTAIAQNNPQPPTQPVATLEPPTLPAATSSDQITSVQIQHIEMQQGSQACTTDAQYVISAKITGAANAQVIYTFSSNNNGTVFAPEAGTTITLDNNGGYDVNAGVRGPFSDPGDVQIIITVLVNGQAVNFASDFICQSGEYKQ